MKEAIEYNCVQKKATIKQRKKNICDDSTNDDGEKKNCILRFIFFLFVKQMRQQQTAAAITNVLVKHSMTATTSRFSSVSNNGGYTRKEMKRMNTIFIFVLFFSFNPTIRVQKALILYVFIIFLSFLTLNGLNQTKHKHFGIKPRRFFFCLLYWSHVKSK